MVNIEELLLYTSELTLLYVEDDPTIQERNCEIFSDFFHQVDLANNGKEGYARYERYYERTHTFYDLVITDIQMPTMDGIAMSQLIQKRHTHQMLIALSAHQDAHYLFELINMGITYFLPKPASTEALYDILFKTSKIVYDRKAAEAYSEKLILLNRKLEDNVIELENAIKKAEEAAEFKDRFFANMSHEIRTPMNAILGLSHILLTSPLKEKERENVVKIENAANVLLQIINNILDFSKIEAGKLSLESTEFSLGSVISYIATIVDIKAADKNINIVYNVDRQIPQRLIGDPTRLGQILLNLVDNAVKFTHEGSVILHVNQLEKEADRCVLKFDIVDHGIGIEEDKLETLFDSFVQADSSTTREYGGSGLGLSITKYLVEMMGGTISIQSHKTEGSTFSVVIPLAYVQNASSHCPTSDASDISGVILKNKTLLLVEDNEVNRHVILGLLEHSEARILVATDGATALEYAETEKIDLILMDINIPVMDGYEVTRQIRDNLNTVPIIGLSANTMRKDIAKALNAGMNAYLQKPMDIQRFYRLLAEYIEESLLRYKHENTEHLDLILAHPFNTISGLDVADALERMEYNVALYERVVHSFFKIFSNAAEELRHHIIHEKYDDAYRLCHDIQGSSGNIGAKELYVMATEMETMIEQHQRDAALQQVACFSQTFLALEHLVSESLLKHNDKGI